MNQVDYKKKYNEALERMKSWAMGEHPECFTEARKAAEFIFPELAESEDERIRKELLDYLEERTVVESLTDTRVKKDWIAWLEKQGKQGNQHLYDIIIALWDLLDKIDTFADLQIDDTDPDNPFRKIEHITGERHEFVKSDGYNLYIKGEKITDFQEQKTMMRNSTKESKCEENDSSTACLEKQDEKESDPRYKFLKELLTADDIYQMAMNDAMVQEAKTKAIDALSKLEIGNLLQIEKQSKQKPEPKFKVGDWVVVAGNVAQILDIQGNYAVFRDTNGKNFLSDYPFHLWTIQDAKDGDVLAVSWYDNGNKWEKIVIFKHLYQDGIEGYGNTFKNGELAWKDENVPYYSQTWTSTLRPATKEQRDLLFKKMKESGYEWDAEKRELKKIEHSKLTEFEEAVKDMMDNYRDAIGDNNATTEEVKKHSEYLLSLIPHKPTAWSEENSCYYDDICEILINLINSPKSKINKDAIQKDLDWLMSIEKSQLKPAWSEEDELNLKQAIYVCHRNGYTAVENWLKSLKPQKHWKPSEYDISLLEEIARKIRTNTKPFCRDVSSLEDLIERLKNR